MRGHFKAIFVFLFLGCVLPFAAFANLSWHQQYSTQMAGEIFDLSREKFLKKFDQEQLVKVLQQIQKKDELTPKQFRKLKRIRLRAQRLRAVYEFFDERHHTPELFDRFVVLYGKLKDALSAEADARPQAANLLGFLKTNHVASLLEDFQPARLQSLTQYAEARFEKLNKWADKNKLPVKKYHKLRKGLRSIYYVLNFLEIAHTEELMGDLEDLELSMGSKHDRVEEREILHRKHPEKLDVPSRAPSLVEKSQQVLLEPRKYHSCVGPLSKK